MLEIPPTVYELVTEDEGNFFQKFAFKISAAALARATSSLAQTGPSVTARQIKTVTTPEIGPRVHGPKGADVGFVLFTSSGFIFGRTFVPLFKMACFTFCHCIQDVCQCTGEGNKYSCTDGSVGYCGSGELCYNSGEFSKDDWSKGCAGGVKDNDAVL